MTPGLHNGWYASPTLTLTGDDGGRLAAIAHTDYSLDGGPWTVYSGPISGFSTGNHFVQYNSTDNVGHVESTKLLAFKVDAVAPTVNISKPADGAVYKLGKVADGGLQVHGQPVRDRHLRRHGAERGNIDTSTIGTHSFTVTGTDVAGNVTTKTLHYTVVYTFNGFFSPIGERRATRSLNLVHAGDLIKIGFGLDGDQRAEHRHLQLRRRSPAPCPGSRTRSRRPARARPPGSRYGVSSGHYSYGWQTSAPWAGTCRQFSLQLNDGTPPHTAIFAFFS